tara:strand:- start:177 stop:287 length:111 start_codon:yes stop_codon:yes gene_type:complete
VQVLQDVMAQQDQFQEQDILLVEVEAVHQHQEAMLM